MQGSDGVPPEPDWSTVYSDELDQVAAAETWAMVIREMREEQTITVANGHAIRRLVDFRVQYERAARHVAEEGPVLRAKRAKVGQWNPYFSVMGKASREISAIESELGLTPSMRGKVTKVKRDKRAARAADSYLSTAKAN